MGWPTDGKYTFDKAKSLVKVFTFKTPGLVSKFAHDLELHTRSLDGTVTVAGDTATVDARINLWDLSIKDGILSRLEANEAEKVLHNKILEKPAKAWATFKGTARQDGGKITLDGELSIAGSRPRKVTLPVTLGAVEKASFGAGTQHEIRQTDYGIEPYKAMMGLLKLEDRVRIEVEATLAP